MLTKDCTLSKKEASSHLAHPIGIIYCCVFVFLSLGFVTPDGLFQYFGHSTAVRPPGLLQYYGEITPVLRRDYSSTYGEITAVIPPGLLQYFGASTGSD